MLTTSAAWKAALEQVDRFPVFLVTITTAVGVEHRFVTADRNLFTTATMGLAAVEAANPTVLDPLTRGVTIGAWDLVFVDESGQTGRIRNLASSVVLKNKRVTIKLGEITLAEGDYQNAGDNWTVDRVIPGPGVIRVSVIDSMGFNIDGLVAPFMWPGPPLKLALGILQSVAPPGAITVADFASTAQTDVSHIVVCRQQWNTTPGFWDIGSGIAGRFWLTLEDDQERQPALDMVRDLLGIITTSMVPDEGGKFRPLKYNRAATAAHTFSVWDVANFEQMEPLEPVTTVQFFGRRHDLRLQSLYSGKDSTAETAQAFPDGATSRVFWRRFPESGPHPWLNSYVLLEDNQTADLDAAATNLRLNYPFYHGFSGTYVEDGAGAEVFPPTVAAQQTAHTLTSGRPAYFLIANHGEGSGGSIEIVKATAYAAVTGGPTLNVDYRLITSQIGTRYFWALGDFTIVRGQLGTSARSWAADIRAGECYVYDITAAVYFTDQLLDRASYGVPRISWVSPARRHDVQLGDAVSLSDQTYLAYGSNGLTSDSVFEITSKAPDLFGSMPGIRFEAARIRVGAVGSLVPATPRDPEPSGTTKPPIIRSDALAGWRRAKAATAAALDACTYASELYLEANANGALGTQDGVTLALNDYLLVKDEADAKTNGVYRVASLGSGGSKWKLVRAPDFASSSMVTPGTAVAISEGTTNVGVWLLTSPDATIELDASDLVFVSTAGSGGGDTLPIVDSTAVVKGSSDPTKLVRIEADGLTTGTTRVLTMADADVSLVPAAPSVTVKSEATSAAAGSAATLLRSDAQLRAATAAPSVNVLTDASTVAQGSSSSLLRADARLLLTTSAPTTQVLSDASTAAQGSATTSLRSDARLIATTAAGSSTGSANAQGSSTSLARADHGHAVTSLVESSGPTGLSIGAVADGEIFTRSGSTVVGRAAVSLMGGGADWLNADGWDGAVTAAAGAIASALTLATTFATSGAVTLASASDNAMVIRASTSITVNNSLSAAGGGSPGIAGGAAGAAGASGGAGGAGGQGALAAVAGFQDAAATAAAAGGPAATIGTTGTTAVATSQGGSGGGGGGGGAGVAGANAGGAGGNGRATSASVRNALCRAIMRAPEFWMGGANGQLNFGTNNEVAQGGTGGGGGGGGGGSASAVGAAGGGNTGRTGGDAAGAIFLCSPLLTGSGTISANGAAGQSGTNGPNAANINAGGGGGGGGCGGGGGGLIVYKVTAITGTLTIQALGGAGGAGGTGGTATGTGQAGAAGATGGAGAAGQIRAIVL